MTPNNPLPFWFRKMARKMGVFFKLAVCSPLGVASFVPAGHHHATALRRIAAGGPPTRTVSQAATTVVSEAEFSRLVAEAVKTNWGDEGTARVLSAWKRLTDGEEYEGAVTHGDSKHELMVQRCSSFVEGLELKPFHDAKEHSWCRALEAEWTTVRDELKSRLEGDEPGSVLQTKGNNVWAGAKNATSAKAYGGGWKTLGLCDRSVWDEANTQLFPRTCELIHRAGVPVVEAFFAKMPEKSKIGAHSDMVNFCLTSHLGIDVPEGECWIEVGDQKREWRNGETMLFDTSVLHRAENAADRTRYILMMRVWHPDLTEVERQAIQFVFDCLDEPDIVVGASPADLFSYTYLRENVEKQSEMMWRSALPPGENEQPKKDMKQKKVKGGKKQKQAQQ
jgi:aspartyl/asparaginyl beta-hydroxylase (cupin superfamily)